MLQTPRVCYKEEDSLGLTPELTPQPRVSGLGVAKLRLCQWLDGVRIHCPRTTSFIGGSRSGVFVDTDSLIISLPILALEGSELCDHLSPTLTSKTAGVRLFSGRNIGC